MRNVVGKPVVGRDFFGRERELDELDRVTQDEHVLLLAPRRVGKTSLLFALSSKVEEAQTAVPVFVSAAIAKTELQFVRAVLQAIYDTREGKRFKPNRIGAWLRRHSRRVKGVKVAGSGIDFETQAAPEWQEEADRAFSTLAGAKHPWLLMIDELPTLVLQLARSDASGERVRAFMQWFRNLRQLPRGGENLRFVLAGSIGLDNVTRRHRLTDLQRASRPVRHACAALGGGARSRDRGAALAQVLLQLLGRAPPGRVRRTGRRPRAQAAGGVRARATRRHDERAPADLARSVPNPKDRTEAVAWILDVLVNDGYLVEDDGRLRFRSGLLRRYWVGRSA